MATSTTSQKKKTNSGASKPQSATAGTKARAPISRGVTRDVEAGSTVDCTFCGERVKFQAKVRNKQVICNVYTKSVWQRVEHYHDGCYVTAGSPYGTPEAAIDYRRRAAAKKAEASSKS